MTRFPLRLFSVLLLALLAGCGGGSEASGPYLARVGDRTLTEADLEEMMAAAPVGLDSLTMRDQLIDQWITNELLAHEAVRQGLDDEPDVRRQLAESRRAVLADALLESLLAAQESAPDEDAVLGFFRDHAEQLRLREPYVRVRHLRTARADEARAARAALDEARGNARSDSLWRQLARTYADDPEGAIALSESHLPESRLALLSPDVAELVRTIAPGMVGPVVEAEDGHHVVQLVGRVPEGAQPELEWVREQISTQVTLRERRRQIARQVADLRRTARSEGYLDIPPVE